MSDLIRREDAINAMAELQGIAQSKAELTGISKAWKRIKALPTASPWHRVEDELPKDRETVLVYCENTGGIVKSHYHEFMGSGGNQHYWFSGGTYHPKYWMPLPEPPKEDA